MAEQVSSTCQSSRVSVPWMIKTGRPDALPGCQDTSILSELPEREIDCGEGNQCYFYGCRKCLLVLLLDVLVPECRTEMVYVPDIGSIKPQKSDMFAENPDYHGEVSEFFANYLRRMDKLKGIAINSWSNKDARKIFLNTERTFDATKYEGSEDFEIDWLISTNSTMAVVEVGMRCEAGKKDSEKKSKNRSEEERAKKVISCKVGQIEKNTIIIRKLLEVTDSSGVLVYFIAVFPNIAFETVQRRIHFHKESLDSLFQPTNNLFKFGVVSKNTIPERTVHLYDQEGRFNEPTDFETLLTERTGQSQMYLASTVVSCMLMTSSAEKQNSTEASEFVIQKPSDVFLPVDEEFWDKGTAIGALGLASKNRSKRILFPEELLLGPDQIKAINSEADATFIVGEAGTGKTLVLLAVLFKYTGKHVSEKKLRQVVFCIPKNKIQFRKDVDLFIKKYSQEDWVQIRETFDGFLSCSDNIYLVDEFYDSTDKKQGSLVSGTRMWVVAVSTSSEALFNPCFTGSIKTIFLRKLYRSDPLISKLCAKISRLVYQKQIGSNDEPPQIPWAMSTGDGIPYKSQNPIQIHLNQKNFHLKFCENEQKLVVYWNEEDFIENSSEENSKEIICHLEGSSLDDLHFTGSKFDNVVLVAGRNIDTTSQEFLIVLYKIISRARKTLKVFSHPSNLADYKSLLTLSDTDVYFDKQRCDNNFSSIAFPNRSSLKEVNIKRLECSQFGKFSVTMMLLEKDPQSLYNKALLQYLKADEMYNPMTITLVDRPYSMTKDFNIHPYLTREQKHLLEALPLLTLREDKSTYLDFFFKLVDADFSTCAELIKSAFRVDELSLLDSVQYLLPRVIKSFKDEVGPLFLKSIWAIYLNAEEFWQFLKKQAISLENLLEKSDGSFWLIRLALSKLNPDHFTELLTSVGVDSLKLSDEQFLDDNRNNILMYCVVRTKHFCIVADWALKQGCLDDMLSQRNCNDETCFVLACWHDNFGLVKALLQKYHYDWPRDGFHAILALCENESILIFKHLLSTLKGDNVKVKLNSMRCSKGVSILMKTTSNAKMMEIFLNFLTEEKLFYRLLYEKDALGRSCLFWAAAFQNIESIKMLIERYKYNWKTDRYIQGQTIAHIICVLEKPDVLKFFVANYGHEFIKVAKELDYAGCSCLETACLFGRSVEVVQMVLNSLNDSLPLPQNFRQLLRCLVAASERNGEIKNKILDFLVSHMLEKLSLGSHEDEIEHHYLVYASDSEDILKIGVRILVGTEELEEADSGEPETFSVGSWKCIFWALSERREIRILTNQPICKMPAILTRSEGNGINIFASWEYLGFLMHKIAEQRLPESCTSTCFKSWEELYEKEVTGLEKHVTR